MKKFNSVYSYDMNTGIYSGSVMPIENPMRPGTPLDIAFTVDVPPLPIKPGYVIKINSNRDGWEYIEDHIGKIVYVDGNKVEITELGPLPENSTLEPPIFSNDDKNVEIEHMLKSELVELDKKVPRIVEDMIIQNVYKPNDIQIDIINRKESLRKQLRMIL